MLSGSKTVHGSRAGNLQNDTISGLKQRLREPREQRLRFKQRMNTPTLSAGPTRTDDASITVPEICAAEIVGMLLQGIP